MTASPRLAMCSVGELFGGVERHLLGMCSWLLRQSRKPLLILFHDAELAYQVRSLGVEPVIIPTNSSVDLLGPWRIAEVLAKNRVDVVHAHGYRAVVNCSLAHRHHKFLLVRTVHGLVEPHRGLSAAWLKSKIYTRMERYFGGRIQSVVTYVTEDLRKHHERLDRKSVTVTIPNGIDPLDSPAFSRPPEFEHDVFQVVAIGRISEVKGLSFALQAMERIHKGARVQLSIIGTGPLEKTLRDETRKRNLESRVKFLGFKKNIYDYMSHADVLIMPSLHEGAPYTILEAMSLGLPVIASRTGGLPELIEDGRSGLLVEVGDVTGFEEALLRIIRDDEFRRKLSVAGKEHQLKRFGLDTMGASFWSLYCDLVERTSC